MLSSCSLSLYPTYRSSPERGEAGECWESRQRRWKPRKTFLHQMFRPKIFLTIQLDPSRWRKTGHLELVLGFQDLCRWSSTSVGRPGCRCRTWRQGWRRSPVSGRWRWKRILWTSGGFQQGQNRRLHTVQCTQRRNMYNCILTWTTQNASWRAEV